MFANSAWKESEAAELFFFFNILKASLKSSDILWEMEKLEKETLRIPASRC